MIIVSFGLTTTYDLRFENDVSGELKKRLTPVIISIEIKGHEGQDITSCGPL